MRRVVLDANIYISALQFGGIAEAVVSAALDGEFTLITSERIRREVEKTLRRRFKWDAEHLLLLESGLWSCAVFVASQKSVGICRDPKDNHLLETSWEAGADLW